MKSKPILDPKYESKHESKPAAPPAIVLIGGTQVFTDLARQYAALQAWSRIESIPAPSKATRSEDLASELVSRTCVGDTIVVLAGDQAYTRGWERKVRLAGREVCVLLDGLTPAGRLQKLHRLVRAKESMRESYHTVRKTLRRLNSLLLEKHPRAGGIKHASKKNIGA
jgi:hypothetical protein